MYKLSICNEFGTPMYSKHKEHDEKESTRFYRMLSPFALRLASPFLFEERAFLEGFLGKFSSSENMNFVSVGAGGLFYLDMAYKYAKKYIAVDPLINIFVNDSVRFLIKLSSKIKLVNKLFDNVEQSDLGDGNSIYVFLFNVLSYVNNPIKVINKIIKQGDILFISGWNMSTRSRLVMQKYFEYVDEDDYQNGFSYFSQLTQHKNFDFSKVKYCKKVQHKVGKVSEAFIIYTDGF